MGLVDILGGKNIIRSGLFFIGCAVAGSLYCHYTYEPPNQGLVYANKVEKKQELQTDIFMKVPMPVYIPIYKEKKRVISRKHHIRYRVRRRKRDPSPSPASVYTNFKMVEKKKPILNPSPAAVYTDHSIRYE